MKILAVDGNSILNRAFYGIKLLSNKKGAYTNACVGFLNILRKVEEDVRPDGIVIAFDLPAPTFRHKQVLTYKANRKGMPEELREQLPRIKQILSCMGTRIIEMEGFEADDILGSISRTVEASGSENTCYLLTGDRDSLQLINSQTIVKLATNRETIHYDTQRFMDDYAGLSPRQLIDLKALMGDSSDNIKGVAGVGEKTAMDLIQRYGSVEGLYSALSSGMGDFKDALRGKLERGEQDAKDSYWLATIVCDLPLEISDFIGIEWKKEELSAVLTELEMFSTLDKLGLKRSTIILNPETSLEDGESDKIVDSSLTVRPVLIPEAKDALEQLEASIFRDCIKNCLEKYAGIESEKSDMTESLLSMWHSNSDSNDVIFFLLMEDGIYFWQGAKMFFVSRADELIIKEFFRSPCKKATIGGKNAYRFAIEHGTSLNNLVFDGELAGYLISSTATDTDVIKFAGLFGETVREDLSEYTAIEVLPRVLFKMEQEIYKAGQEELLFKVEQPLSLCLASMELFGIALSTKDVETFGIMIKERLSEVECEIFELVGHTFNVSSPKQLGVVLFEELELPSKKKTKTGYSTDVKVLESLVDKHPIIDKILTYRQLSKLSSTYVEGLLKLVGTDGRLHSTFKQTETRTGRISSTEPNLQNIPVRSELGSQMRKFFVAPPGRVLLDADYSQIELRIVAALSGDETMTEAFLSGEDIHTSTAAQVFGMPKEMVTSSMRRAAKAVNFGILYGIGAFSLSKDIGVSVQEGKEYIATYLKQFPKIKEFMDTTIENARKNGFVTTIFGRRRYIPELAMSNKIQQAFGERAAMNAPIQGAAADVIKIAMIRVFRRLREEKLDAVLVLQVHDELIVESSEGDADKAAAILQQEMQMAVTLSVPLTTEVSSGENWYVAKG